MSEILTILEEIRYDFFEMLNEKGVSNKVALHHNKKFRKVRTVLSGQKTPLKPIERLSEALAETGQENVVGDIELLGEYLSIIEKAAQAYLKETEEQQAEFERLVGEQNE